MTNAAQFGIMPLTGLLQRAVQVFSFRPVPLFYFHASGDESMILKRWHDNWKNIKLASQIACWSYQESVPDKLAARPDLHVKMIDMATVQAMVISDTNTVVIGIAGTNENLDHFLNVQFKSKLRAGLLVHHGFDFQASLLSSALHDYDMKGRDIFLIGHSQGGAVAGLLPMIYDGFKDSAVKIYAFNAPRFIASESAAFYSYSYTNIRYPLDIVPDLPVRLWGGRAWRQGWPSMSQVGSQIFVDRDGTTDTEHSGLNSRLSRYFRLAGAVAASGLGLGSVKSIKSVYQQLHSMQLMHESIMRVKDRP